MLVLACILMGKLPTHQRIITYKSKHEKTKRLSIHEHKVNWSFIVLCVAKVTFTSLIVTGSNFLGYKLDIQCIMSIVVSDNEFVSCLIMFILSNYNDTVLLCFLPEKCSVIILLFH